MPLPSPDRAKERSRPRGAERGEPPTLLAVWLFRGPEGARYLVILGVLVAADATSTYLLQLQDEMFVVREWLWMLILFGSAGFVWWRKRRAEPPE